MTTDPKPANTQNWTTTHRFDTPVPNAGSLHRLDNERDACGVGFVAAVDGAPSHEILRWGLDSVSNVTHRGAVNADGKTGDGAGVTTTIPRKIFRRWLDGHGSPAAAAAGDDYGVGVFFLPQDESAALKCKVLAEGLLNNRGCRPVGWREVPTNPKELGDQARESLPQIAHLVIARPTDSDDASFERALYLARKEIAAKVEEEGISGFYIPSLSGKTISYKALIVATGLEKFYADLCDPDYECGICLYHQRFSTNTFPSWALGQPFRMLAHNGEINTIRGNRNWLRSRESAFESPLWGEDVKTLSPITDPRDSDSASLDNALELLTLSGRHPTHAMAMLMPPAWRIDPSTPEAHKDFYLYHRCFAEPWDGPAAVAFTDGVNVGACLDRNGLRPARYKLTKDGIFTLGSEVGVVEIPDENIVSKGRLSPGEMVCIDTAVGEVLFDKEIKDRLAAAQPYGRWLEENRVAMSEHVAADPPEPGGEIDILTLTQQQVAAGVSKEELDMSLAALLSKGMEATYSMGDDTPLAVLSRRPRMLSHYFKQLFAQVTNPPIDPIRERLVMTLGAGFGPERNYLAETPGHAKILNVDSPVLCDHQLEALANFPEFPATTIDITWPVAEGAAGLEPAVDRICAEAEAAVDGGAQILVLSDRAVDHARCAIPAVMAVGAVHHHLNRSRKRLRCSFVADTADARDPHSLAVLFGFGATAVCPHLAFASAREMLEKDAKGVLGEIGFVEAAKNIRAGLEKGLLKIMSKMGISVLNSYQGAQIFEAVGIGAEVADKCFTGVHSKLGGVGFAEIASESLARHAEAFGVAVPEEGGLKLDDPGFFRYRAKGEVHAINGPAVLKPFHAFVKSNDTEEYKKFVEAVRDTAPVAPHDLFELVPAAGGPVPLDEVEPIEEIRRRFTTAAMSLGAISPEAHEALAEAMNLIGGKSDSGEGGEDPVRFNTVKNSKIKQIASGRFGVSAEYLASAEELEIKMAQGAKPGEGGQLPGFKVNSLIARLRRTQPGVQLISPPPHHDIYSIEDLAQLIHDLKEVNPRARVCVKLVAETGVGTIAAGVAKANADIILVSGHEGGTGASPLSSIKHAGLPWEIGLAETQQVLMLNGLRDRVTLRTDGGLRTGLDIIHAACLGAEEFNFGTIALIALGCVYVRKCHLNTCPVGIATQDPKYRAKYKGAVENVVNYMNAVSGEVREIMAALGVRKLDDLIGRPGFLRQRQIEDHPKANLLDLSPVLKDVTEEAGEELPRRCRHNRNDGDHEHPLDDTILQHAKDAIRDKVPVTLDYKVRNTNRNVGTKLSGQIAYLHGDHGLPEGTVNVNLRGSAGQSFGTFLCGGVKLDLVGEANDYVGKGMCGGEIIIRPPEGATFAPHENSIIGNTCLYGASGGRLFANGRAGERFCVRNSGGTGVVEGCGDHGCEYMTNGVALILGSTGKNFGAGMSGGVAYVYDEDGTFEQLYNPEMVKAEPLADEADVALVQQLAHDHLERTDSARASEILKNWSEHVGKFFKISPSEPPNPPAYDQPEASEETAKAGA